jgi:hypothetical protein
MNPHDDDRETVLHESEQKYHDKVKDAYYKKYYSLVRFIDANKEHLKSWKDAERKGDDIEAPYRIQSFLRTLQRLEKERKELVKDFEDSFHQPMFMESYFYSHEDLPPFEDPYPSRKRRRSQR